MKNQAIVNVNKFIYGYRMNRARSKGLVKVQFDHLLYDASRHKRHLLQILAAGK